MKIKTVIILILTIVIFCQCRSIQLNRIERLIKKSTDIDFINKPTFEKCQQLMFKTLPYDIIKNDTIIILEYFTDLTQFYSCTIYRSKDKKISSYDIEKSIKKGIICIDSLINNDLKDGIMPMVINNQLDEVKKRGEAPGWTPATTLIINILTKDREKNKYNIQTIQTQKFSTHKEMPQELWEETRKGSLVNPGAYLRSIIKPDTFANNQIAVYPAYSNHFERNLPNMALELFCFFTPSVKSNLHKQVYLSNTGLYLCRKPFKYTKNDRSFSFFLSTFLPKGTELCM